MRALISGIFGAFGTAARRVVEPIEVRSATAAEVVDVRHVVLRAGRPRESAVFQGDTKPTTRHWVAQQADRVVAVASVMAAEAPDGLEARWQLRGMAVLPELQGAGVGRALLSALQIDVGEALWCNAREGVVLFYRRNGWEPVGEPFDIEGIGPHVRMICRP